jgi:hypothetical protein
MKITFRALVILISSSTLDLSLAGDVTEVPAYDQFLVIPLRLHVLTTKNPDLGNSRMTDAELVNTVERINDIWHKAGIHFGLEAIFREPAIQEERFWAMLELQKVQQNNNQNFFNNTYAYLLPASTRAFAGLHLYIFQELPFNSLYVLPLDATLVKEKPELVPVEGGSKYPVARVASRGFGLALGLTTRQDEFGALSSGTNGVGLNEGEVATARRIATTIQGAKGVGDLAREAETALREKNIEKARRLWTWLSEVPGEGAAIAKKKLENLPSGKP